MQNYEDFLKPPNLFVGKLQNIYRDRLIINHSKYFYRLGESDSA